MYIEGAEAMLHQRKVLTTKYCSNRSEQKPHKGAGKFSDSFQELQGWIGPIPPPMTL